MRECGSATHRSDCGRGIRGPPSSWHDAPEALQLSSPPHAWVVLGRTSRLNLRRLGSPFKSPHPKLLSLIPDSNGRIGGTPPFWTEVAPGRRITSIATGGFSSRIRVSLPSY